MENNAAPTNLNDIEVNLKLNVNDVNIIIGGLRELPHRISDDVIRKVVTQAQGQVPNPNGQQNAGEVPPNFYNKQ
jgi:hypothetical protein